MVNVQWKGVYDHKIKGQVKVMYERIKFQLQNMLEICTAEAKPCRSRSKVIPGEEV